MISIKFIITRFYLFLYSINISFRISKHNLKIQQVSNRSLNQGAFCFKFWRLEVISSGNQLFIEHDFLRNLLLRATYTITKVFSIHFFFIRTT